MYFIVYNSFVIIYTSLSSVFLAGGTTPFDLASKKLSSLLTVVHVW